MNTNKNRATAVGVLFILAAVTAIIGVFLYKPILNETDYIIKAAAKETQVLWGAFFEIILAFSVIGTSITLFPILKKHNEKLKKTMSV